MAVAGLFVAAGFAIWIAIYARRASLPAVAVATLITGYVFGHSFWNVHVGPLPLTFDRLMLIALAGLFAWRCWQGSVRPSSVAAVDWALAATLVWLTLSALTSRPDDSVYLPSSPFWRLAMSFWTPAFLFLVARQSTLDQRTTRIVLWSLSGLGIYLMLTALAETAGAWAFVFPRYIADPELGLHFGRARGPALNSVSLGIFLSVCFWATWVSLPRAGKLVQLVLVVSLPLMAFAVLLTFTRSTWIGLAASGMAVLAAQLPRQWRAPALGSVTVVALATTAVLWQSVMNLEREDSGSVSAHSVQQRTAFAYVSWKMFNDNPLWGVGFGRFYDQKLPYLSDRSQTFELESLRDLHHHNTMLSLLTETGMIGLAAYLGVLGGLLACGWRLSQATSAPAHERALGVLLVATVMVYLPSAVFHDLTHLHNDQWLLLLIGGLAVGCERRRLAPLPEPTVSHASTGMPARSMQLS